MLSLNSIKCFKVSIGIYFVLTSIVYSADTLPASILAPPVHTQLSQTEITKALDTLFQWNGSSSYSFCLLNLPEKIDIKHEYATDYSQMIDKIVKRRHYRLQNPDAAISLTVPSSLQEIPNNEGMCVVMDGFNSRLPVRAANVFSWNFDCGFATRLVLGEYIKAWRKAGLNIDQQDLDFGLDASIQISSEYTNIFSYKFYFVGAIPITKGFATTADLKGANGNDSIIQYPSGIPANNPGSVIMTAPVQWPTRDATGNWSWGTWFPYPPGSLPITGGPFSISQFYPDICPAKISPSTWLPYKIDINSVFKTIPAFKQNPAQTIPLFGDNRDALILLPDVTHPQQPNYTIPGFNPSSSDKPQLVSTISFENGLYYQLKAHNLQAPGILWGWRAASELESYSTQTGDTNYLNAAMILLKSRFTTKEIGELSGYTLAYLQGYSKILAGQRLSPNLVSGVPQAEEILAALSHDKASKAYTDLLVSLNQAFIAEFYALSGNKHLKQTVKNQLISKYASFISGFQAGSIKTTDVLYNEIFEQGYEIGVRQGFQTGFSEGYSSGYRDGYNIGYSSGYSDAWQRANIVISNLEKQMSNNSGGSSLDSWVNAANTVATIAEIAIAVF